MSAEIVLSVGNGDVEGQRRLLRDAQDVIRLVATVVGIGTAGSYDWNGLGL